MLKENLNRKDFHPENYSKIALVKTYKNGSEDYKAVCICPRCGGRGFVNFSSVDNSRCWQCEETGKVLVLIHVSDITAPKLSNEQVLENIRKHEEAEKNHNLELGFKPIDFKLASSFANIWFNQDTYYRIIKETEKAYLLGRLDNIKGSYLQEITFWVPKSGITFIKEAKLGLKALS